MLYLRQGAQRHPPQGCGDVKQAGDSDRRKLVAGRSGTRHSPVGIQRSTRQPPKKSGLFFCEKQRNTKLKFS